MKREKQKKMNDIKREIKEEKIRICWKVTSEAVSLNEKREAEEDERHKERN